jgi:hypothetical protein
MAVRHLLESKAEILDRPHPAGSLPQHRHDSLRGLGSLLKEATRKTHMFESGAIGTNASIQRSFIAPHRLLITGVDGLKSANVGAGSDLTAPMQVAGARNPIDGTIDLHALANPNEAEEQVLAAEASRIVEKGEVVTCTFTTDATTTLAEGAAVALHYQPIE